MSVFLRNMPTKFPRGCHRIQLIRTNEESRKWQKYSVLDDIVNK